MTKQSAIQMLDKVVGKLNYLAANISGPNYLTDAAVTVAVVRDRLRAGNLFVKHAPPKPKKKPSSSKLRSVDNPLNPGGFGIMP